MWTHKTYGPGLATGAQLALVAFLSIGLTTTTHESTAGTLPSPRTARTGAVAYSFGTNHYPPTTPLPVDADMGALTPSDAALYREIFAVQKIENWNHADKIMARVSDKRLMGHVLSDRFEKRGASPAEQAAWLKAYATHPDAQSIYEAARRMGGIALTAPTAPEAWRSGGEKDVVSDFLPTLIKNGPEFKEQNKLGRAILKALRSGHPGEARQILATAQIKGTITKSFVNDAEALIAFSFFGMGERTQTADLAKRAAQGNQPLGLWVTGLLCWEKRDFHCAYSAFSHLATLPGLTTGSNAAASFWAYRAATKQGRAATAQTHLLHAALNPHSFYGLMASDLLGRNPQAAAAKDTSIPKWNDAMRALLMETEAGWRALALIQIGEIQRAESELRRLNPQGNQEQRQAMYALASYIPMPGLAIQLAFLSKQKDFDATKYPVLPWEPHDGFQVDRAFLFALARQESMFDPKAESARGAQGLLQIMPATANGLTKDHPELQEMLRQDKIFDPAFNMALGQKYVQHLASLSSIGNNLVMVLAAYNGGPAKAVGWKAAQPNDDPLLFLESIPVQETRHYIQRVLPHYWAYRARLGKQAPSLQQLAVGQWPKAPLTEDASVRVADAVR